VRVWSFHIEFEHTKLNNFRFRLNLAVYTMALSGIEVVPQFETEHYPEMLLITKDCRKKTCHPCKQWMGGRAVAFHPTVLLVSESGLLPNLLEIKGSSFSGSSQALTKSFLS